MYFSRELHYQESWGTSNSSKSFVLPAALAIITGAGIAWAYVRGGITNTSKKNKSRFRGSAATKSPAPFVEDKIVSVT